MPDISTPHLNANHLQGTATVGKGLMNRNDQFTKLMGDVNKQQQLL